MFAQLLFTADNKALSCKKDATKIVQLFLPANNEVLQAKPTFVQPPSHPATGMRKTDKAGLKK